MSGKLSKFQTREFTSWMGMSKKNHMGGIFQAAPQKSSNLMVKLLGFRNGKTLETFISKFPTKQFDSDDEFVWDVIGSSKKNVPLIEARDENGNVVTAESPNIGVGTTPFYLVFPEAWFSDGKLVA